MNRTDLIPEQLERFQLIFLIHDEIACIKTACKSRNICQKIIQSGKTYHRMKGSSRLEKIVSYLPDGWVRDALLLALEGRDLIEEKNRQRGRTRNIGYELR